MAALELGMRYSSKLATTHLALAAGWSGPQLQHRGRRSDPDPAALDGARGPRRDPDRGRSCEPDRATGAAARLRRGRHPDRGRRHGAGLMAQTSGRVDRPIVGRYASRNRESR